MKPVREWSDWQQVLLWMIGLPLWLALSSMHEMMHAFGIEHGRCWFLGYGHADYRKGAGIKVVNEYPDGTRIEATLHHTSAGAKL